MLAKAYSFGLTGIEAYPVEIEVDVSKGLPAITVVGLADAAIKESRERVKSAIKNSGLYWPDDRITISMAPSDIHKEGASFDLAIALGVLCASGQLDPEGLKKYCAMGELSLDGTLRPAKGILPISMALCNTKIRDLIIPCSNAKEAAIVTDISAWPARTLKEVVGFLNKASPLPGPFKVNPEELFRQNLSYPMDFSEVKGQYHAKRAMEVAVAGGHNILPMGTQYDRQTGRPTD